MTVPTSFFQGDTVEWTVSLADYPASAWQLTYTFTNPAGNIKVPASPDGDDHKVSLAPSVTATYLPGDYCWVAKVEDIATGLQVHTVSAGKTTIHPDASALNSYDCRSWAQIALDNVEAVIANRATVDQESYSIQGRSLSRTPMADLINLRKYLQSEIIGEEDANSSGPSQKKAVVRF